MEEKSLARQQRLEINLKGALSQSGWGRPANRWVSCSLLRARGNSGVVSISGGSRKASEAKWHCSWCGRWVGVFPFEQGRKAHFMQKELYVQGHENMKEHGTCGMPQLSYSGHITHLPCFSFPIYKMGIGYLQGRLMVRSNVYNSICHRPYCYPFGCILTWLFKNPMR